MTTIAPTTKITVELFDAPVKIDPRDGMVCDIDKDVYRIAENAHMLVFEPYSWRQDSSPWRQYWLEVDGVIVGFLNTLERDYKETTTLTDIEVRPEHQGRGHVATLLAASQKIAGTTFYSTGSCTPKGYAAMKDRVPLLPYEEEWKISFRDMIFVRREEHWDQALFVNA